MVQGGAARIRIAQGPRQARSAEALLSARGARRETRLSSSARLDQPLLSSGAGRLQGSAVRWCTSGSLAGKSGASHGQDPAAAPGLGPGGRPGKGLLARRVSRGAIPPGRRPVALPPCERTDTFGRRPGSGPRTPGGRSSPGGSPTHASLSGVRAALRVGLPGSAHAPPKRPSGPSPLRALSGRPGRVSRPR